MSVASTMTVEDRRRRVGLVYNDATIALRNKTREKLEKLSLVVVWERPLIDRSAARELNKPLMNHVEAVVMVTTGLANNAQQSVKYAAKTWEVMTFPVSDRVAEWDELRKWATRPFVVVKQIEPRRTPPVDPPTLIDLPVTGIRQTVNDDRDDMEAIAREYAAAADRAKADLDSAMLELANQRANTQRLEREISGLKSAPAPDTRDAEAKRHAADSRCRKAEDELTESRREMKRLRDSLAKAEEDRDAAESAAKQVRKRPPGGETSKVVAALNVLVVARAMTAEEAWERVVETSK